MGIRNNRYDAMVPQVVAPLRLKGRVHAFEAQLARAHTEEAEVHPARPDDHRRHRGRPVLRRQGQDGFAFAELLNQEAWRCRPMAWTSSSSTSRPSTST
jgi:5-methyltetrahydropteroyltriglutamate--homocysteine methyltransferase